MSPEMVRNYFFSTKIISSFVKKKKKEKKEKKSTKYITRTSGEMVIE